MPASWISAGVGLYNAYEGSKKSGSSGSSGPTNVYSPQGLTSADNGWQHAFSNIGDIANTVYDYGSTRFLDTLAKNDSIDYTPYTESGKQVGQQYGQLATTAGQQMGQYGQNAQLAGQQQQSLYGGANTLLEHAFDPNMTQYNRSANDLTGQVNAGQAARGLGNSPVGAQEYGQTMSNFNNDWQTAQLQRQQSGLAAAAQGSNAGGAQGQLMGANLAAMLGAGEQQAGYTQQSALSPIQAMQYAYGQPAANANAYIQNMGGLSNLYGQQAGLATPYMNQGQGAQQYNVGYNTTQNASNTQALLSGVNGLFKSGTNGSPSAASQAGSWLGNLFGGSGSSSGGDSGAGSSSGSFGSGESIWA